MNKYLLVRLYVSTMRQRAATVDSGRKFHCPVLMKVDIFDSVCYERMPYTHPVKCSRGAVQINSALQNCDN